MPAASKYDGQRHDEQLKFKLSGLYALHGRYEYITQFAFAISSAFLKVVVAGVLFTAFHPVRFSHSIKFKNIFPKVREMNGFARFRTDKL
jgi:hypothetical protein